MNAFELAGKQLGLNESDQKAALQDYLVTGGQNLDPATTAWCAAFVNATLAQSGGQGTGKLNARSYLDWGQAVDKPQQGDIAVFSRGDPNGWQGHVGFFEGYNPDGTIRVLGGNQGDSVSVASFSPDSLLGFRRDGNALANAYTPDSQGQDPQTGQPANAFAPQNALAGYPNAAQQQAWEQSMTYTPLRRSRPTNALSAPIPLV
ncbi:TIGR02594 family protein [Paracoccus sp. KR1-242]|uniref:TIGR02594 family protein n=1 Tax=Paracoccus sp. KR1-242 TaxID=3410028 RepID=UPI003C11552A